MRDRVFGGRSGSPRAPVGGALVGAVLVLGVVGSALLLAAEFAPLLSVHSSASRAAIETVQTGSHDSFALVPVALLALLLCFEIWRTRSRLPMLAIGLLGLLALALSLLRDLPDAQATGVVGSVKTGLRLAASTPALGLYLESLGGVALLFAAVTGLLLVAPRVPGPTVETDVESA